MNKEIPTLNEMLKLYSKKDLWDRIQDKNQIIKQKDQQIVELKKALELLKDKNNYFTFVNENTGTVDVDYAIDKAKEMLENE